MDALPFALLLLMLINASSMFEFHMLVVAAIMFYILELIMQIVPIIQQSKNLIVGNFLS